MNTNENVWDVIVVGGGSAGLPTAIFSAERGAKVLLVDHAEKLGGTLWVAHGQMSAAGTRLQREKGIDDSADEHYADVMRISRNTANPQLVRLAVDHAGPTFDWLMDMGFVPGADQPVKGFGHEPYLKDRYYWGDNWGRSVKDVLVPLVESHAAEGRITIRLQHEVTELLTDAAGAVIGLAATDTAGERHEFFARNVALTCGGYGANPEMFAQLSGYPQYHGGPYPFARGAGIKLGLSVGGYLRGHENVFNNFGALFNTDTFPAQPVARVETFPEWRQPWEIYVNVHGQRFVREDIGSVDARETALFGQPNRRFWIIFDQHVLDNAPPIIMNWSREDMAQAFTRGGPGFIKAGTLDELAAKSGIDADGLKASVYGYNYGIETGHDFFGRQHKPARIGQPPFYALRMQGCSTSSAVGLAVNNDLQVIRQDGSVIPNLFAAGELLGSGQTMGKAACGGMMVTPAMTFGRLLGQRLMPLGQNEEK